MKMRTCSFVKVVGVMVWVFILLFLVVWSGCEPAASEITSKADNGFNQLSTYAWYVPDKLDIMPLTELINVGDGEEASKIRVYVSLLDAFDSQIKTPGIFRFELYEYIERSAEPKGRRIIIWPDIDLVGTVANNEHWRDFLRAYEFNLEFEPDSTKSYILQATCMCPNGKRLSSEFGLKAVK